MAAGLPRGGNVSLITTAKKSAKAGLSARCYGVFWKRDDRCWPRYRYAGQLRLYPRYQRI